MSFPAPPPIGLETMGEVRDVHVEDVLVPSAHGPAVFDAVAPVTGARASIVGSALLGLAAGHRAMAPLAVLALAPPRRGIALPVLAVALAAAELVVDKLPFVPGRTAAMPLVARALAGVLAGGWAARRSRRSPVIGAAMGGAAAVAATGLGLQLRVAAEDSLPRVVAALIEDVLAIGMAVGGSRLLPSNTERASETHEPRRLRVAD